MNTDKKNTPDTAAGKINLTIKPRDGFASVVDVRRIFEQSIASTASLRKVVRLDPQIAEGVFNGYKSHQTDVLWIGFALGIRCCERLEQQGHPANMDTFSRLNVAAEEVKNGAGDTTADRVGAPALPNGGRTSS